MQIPIANCKMIWWSICGCSKQTTLSFICNLFIWIQFIWISNYLLFVCMNNNFNAIPGSISIATWMPLFEYLDQIYNKMGHVVLLGWCLGAWLGNRRPHTKIDTPQNGPKNACAGHRLRGRVEMLWDRMNKGAIASVSKLLLEGEYVDPRNWYPRDPLSTRIGNVYPAHWLFTSLYGIK
jgi:hypothetical protein